MTLRVFISSASGALAPYREAAVRVCQRLHLTPVYMEDFTPERLAPLEVCQRKVSESDVFVLLLAHRYGARPAGVPQSYTELEYEWAVARAGMPLLAFVVDPDFPWPPREVDAGADAEALNAFKARVRSRHEGKRLADLASFREDLLIALSRLIPAPAAEDAPIPTRGRKTQRQGRQPGSQPNDGQPSVLPRAPAFFAAPPYVGSAPFTGRAEDLARLDEWGRSADPVMVVEAIGGTGKSALTWEWTTTRAEAAIDGLAGRMWWSFYDGSASMTRFLQELLRHASGWPAQRILGLDRAALADEVMAQLRAKPYLIVLDGFERLLTAYHRFDPSKLRDEDVAPDARSLIEANADDIVRRFAAAGPSKVLISTRLMPTALESRFGRDVPGVLHERLPGLADVDVPTLLGRLGVHGSDQAVASFFRPLGNHPLLAGVVAGLVLRDRTAPGDFDRWLADPTAGGALSVPDLDLTQRRTHILTAALSGLDPGSRRLLGWISVLAGAVKWDTLVAINPFRPDPPAPVQPDFDSLGPEPKNPSRFAVGDDFAAADEEAEPLARRRWAKWSDAAKEWSATAERETAALMATWSQSDSVLRARGQLAAALDDLEDRGLLWWDRSSNTYDLHPIIRAYAHDQLEDGDRVQANDRVSDHFQSLPAENLDKVASVEDLTQTIAIFRALVGGGHVYEAEGVWTRFGNTLIVNLGAYATAVELLEPLRSSASSYTSTHLGFAYNYLGKYSESLDLEFTLLNQGIRESDDGVWLVLANIEVNFSGIRAVIASKRCVDLEESICQIVNTVDADLYLTQAQHAFRAGQTGRARTLLGAAEVTELHREAEWFDDDLIVLRLRLAHFTDHALTHNRIDAALAEARSLDGRRQITALRVGLCLQEGDLERALTAALECDRLSRNAGLEVAPAMAAYILARLRRPDEATLAVNEALAKILRMHPARWPHYDLARALRELGRQGEAAAHAREAYRQAWADGPPNHSHWELQDARELLESMGQPLPELPTVDPATVKIPLEDEIRAFIARLETERRARRGRRTSPR
jgi:tetratricopeptide (TPR) repeat protein